MEPVLKQREGNYMIEVYRDEDAPNPRKDWDPACHMVVSSRHVETEMDGADDALVELCLKYRVSTEMSFARTINELNKFIVIHPLSLYVHSGVCIRLGFSDNPWDSGNVGFCYMERDDLDGPNVGRNEKGYPNWRDQCEAIIQAEFDSFERWLDGEVYGFMTKKLIEPSEAMKATPEYSDVWWEDDERNWEEYDSCWGFYLRPEQVVEEAKSYIGGL